MNLNLLYSGPPILASDVLPVANVIKKAHSSKHLLSGLEHTALECQQIVFLDILPWLWSSHHIFHNQAYLLQGWTLKMINSHLQKAPCSPSDTQYRVQISHHSGISWLTEQSSHQSVFGWKNYLQCIKSPTPCNWKNRYFISMVPLKQGCSVLLLEGQSPAEFSSNLPKHKIPSITENLE